MTQHALIPISSLYRFFLCPGSFILSEGIERKDTVDSKKGTAIHGLAASYFSRESVTIAEEQAEAFHGYVSFVKSKEEIFGVKGKAEHRVYITPNVWGTADYTIVAPPYGVVIDYKDGVQEVPALNNAQLAGYAVALAQAYNLSKVYTYIYQPNSPSPSPVKDWEMDETILAVWHDRILNLEQQLLGKGGLPCYPSDVACQWCPAVHKCKARKKEMNEIVKIEKQFPTPSSLTPEQLSEVMRVGKRVKNFVDSVEDYIRDTDIEIPNVEKKEGARNRKWTNEVEATIRLESLGLEATHSSLITVAQAEKLLGDKFKQVEDLVSETRNKTRVIYRG